MTDPVAAGAAAAASPEIAAPAAQQQAQAASRFAPGETQMFAKLMQGVPMQNMAASGTGTLGDAAKAMAAQLSGNVRSFEEMRKSMLESVDFRDPIKTMFVMTDHSLEAHMMFTKMHISTGLASAATSLFGTLLKNQQ
jgi:alanine dehydrogenase